MEKELQEYFYKTYPLLFSGKDESNTKTLMCYGMCCRKGWFRILDNLCASLEPKIRGWVDQNPDKESHPRISQIKEKFGGFRFYMTEISLKNVGEELSKEIYSLIAQAEEESYTVCEFCGVSGELRKDLPWKKTLCEKCYENHIKKYVRNITK